MSNTGITCYGVYLPKLRLERSAIAAAHAWAAPSLKKLANGERTYCNWDEDSITLAVEATRTCMRSSPNIFTSLTLATTTPVFSDFQNASMVATAAGMDSATSSMDMTGSLRAGLSALIQALKTKENRLVVAADNRTTKPVSVQEMLYGVGSAAVGVGNNQVIARYIGSRSRSEVFVDHFRPAAEPFDYFGEERWVRDAGILDITPPVIRTLLEDTKLTGADIAHFCMAGVNRKTAALVAKQASIDGEAAVDDLGAHCGDTGTPQIFMLLAAVLENAKPGDKILLVGFGAGCDVLLLEATESLADYNSAAPLSAALASGRPEAHYTKLLSFHGLLEQEWGMRAEGDTRVSLSQLQRSQDQIIGFTGGRCSNCGAVQFPRMAACVNCGTSAGMTPAPLADEPAKVTTFTADWLQYHPSPPLYFGLVQFNNGARLLMEMVDVDPDSFDVGTPLRMVFRIKQKDPRRGFHRYFWKATPMTELN